MKPTSIIIHHELGNNGFDGVNRYHQQIGFTKSSLGWYVGYQWYIASDGTKYQARKDDEEGCHTIGRNSDSIGICLEGNLDIQQPTANQLITLKALVLQKMKEWTIEPEQIFGHRFYAHYKTCPGRNISDAQIRSFFQADLNYIQIMINAIRDKLNSLSRMGAKSECVGSDLLKSKIINMDKQEILNRLKSFVWRLAGMAAVAGLAWLSSNLDLFHLSPEIVGLVSLVVGELTKWLNNKFALEEQAVGAIKKLSGRN